MLGPPSHNLLLTLPATRLKEAFILHPALHNPLLQHLQNLAPASRAIINKEVVALIKSPPPEATLHIEESHKVHQPISISKQLPLPPLLPQSPLLPPPPMMSPPPVSSELKT